jgi:hypothetical protein
MPDIRALMQIVSGMQNQNLAMTGTTGIESSAFDDAMPDEPCCPKCGEELDINKECFNKCATGPDAHATCALCGAEIVDGSGGCGCDNSSREIVSEPEEALISFESLAKHLTNTSLNEGAGEFSSLVRDDMSALKDCVQEGVFGSALDIVMSLEKKVSSFLSDSPARVYLSHCKAIVNKLKNAINADDVEDSETLCVELHRLFDKINMEVKKASLWNKPVEAGEMYEPDEKWVGSPMGEETDGSMSPTPPSTEPMDVKAMGQISVNKTTTMGTNGTTTNVSISADGQKADELIQIIKLSGLVKGDLCEDIKPAGQEGGDGETGEDQDEWENEPNEQVLDSHTQLVSLSGGLNGPKQQVNPYNKGDNAMTIAMKQIEESERTLENRLRKEFREGIFSNAISSSVPMAEDHHETLVDKFNNFYHEGLAPLTPSEEKLAINGILDGKLKFDFDEQRLDHGPAIPKNRAKNVADFKHAIAEHRKFHADINDAESKKAKRRIQKNKEIPLRVI